ncbi:MAG: glycosyltransferase family 4 protein [Deltaproteobacteria bacterium]|nr:glycosyltransferase family 4 protein [Deltaproteobacteria bacterium]
MDLAVTTEYRFRRTPDGRVWTAANFDHGFWSRYLEVFERVRVVARIEEVLTVSENCKESTGEHVAFTPLPYYKGSKAFVRRYPELRKRIKEVAESRDAFILRVPSTLAGRLAVRLKRSGHPYGAEVVGDPHGVFSPGAVNHPLRSFLRRWFGREMAVLIRGACSTAYVTRNALQRRYPSSPNVFTTHFSSIVLKDRDLATEIRSRKEAKQRYRLISVGSLEQPYKGMDVLIDAVVVCARSGLDLELKLVGDGRYRNMLEDRVSAKGLKSVVEFTGELPGSCAVREQLDRADLFVMASRTEGLPQAMIEAMARGLPCIGTNVGGIPELLPKEALVPPGEVGALATKIREMITDPQRMRNESRRNLEEARQYRETLLRARRVEFYDHVMRQNEQWLRTTRRDIRRDVRSA